MINVIQMQLYLNALNKIPNKKKLHPIGLLIDVMFIA